LSSVNQHLYQELRQKDKSAPTLEPGT
jgi:hypothetical protein